MKAQLDDTCAEGHGRHLGFIRTAKRRLLQTIIYSILN